MNFLIYILNFLKNNLDFLEKFYDLWQHEGEIASRFDNTRLILGVPKSYAASQEAPPAMLHARRKLSITGLYSSNNAEESKFNAILL